MLSRLGAGARDRSGAVAVEFAFVAPLMIILFFGLAQLSEAIIASRHANHSSSSVGDLVAQCSNINDQDLSNIFYAGGDVMAPLPFTSGLIQETVTSVMATDNNGTTKVQWSETSDGSNKFQAKAVAGAVGKTVVLPANIDGVDPSTGKHYMAQNDSIIIAETVYNYTFPVSAGGVMPVGSGVSLSFGQAMKFDVVTYFKPRRSSVVAYTGTGPGGSGASSSTEGTSCYAG